MKTPTQYQHDLGELHAEDVHTDGLSEGEARQHLEKVNQMLEKLSEMENSLNLDLHAMRAQYQGRASALQMQTGRHAGRSHVEEEQRLEDERLSKLAPYNEVRTQIEQLREQLEGARGKLEQALPGSR